ncbi:MAG: DUF3318 domain-containing protein [Kamptonema sp. SIO1D9]|nr:DUF3318 domain-containing protein [Kamptonema sp. SIO1D9]
MNPDPEIRHLLDLMPASGRMNTKIVSKPQQAQVIDAPFVPPWHRRNRPIYINFDLWRDLSRSQRDLLLLRSVSWLLGFNWFKPNVYQGIVLVGLLDGIVEFSQGDALGVAVAGGLSAIAATRIWRNAKSSRREIDADEAAIKVALRRGYSEAEAARYLLEAVETVARIEGRSSLNFTELIRCQNLRAIANLSPVSVPANVRQEQY